MIKTIQIRVKDRHSKLLAKHAKEVNFVWNFVNDLSYTAIRTRKQFMSGYDIQNYTKGSTKAGLSISATTVQCIGIEYATRRRQFKKAKLRWRSSKGSKKSLGWIPLRYDAISVKNNKVSYCGHEIALVNSNKNKNFDPGSGSFSQDSRGKWYFNSTIKVDITTTESSKSVGIDLGLKDIAVTSDGDKLTCRPYREFEEKLKAAQRANKKNRVRAIHAKIQNKRKDTLHKFTTKLVQIYSSIFVGNVNSSKLAKTNMAKSVYDASWFMFKRMLEYKSHQANIRFQVIDESFTTQTCSNCGCLPQSRPKGIVGLGIREWTCSECNTFHDRDVNSAKNILALGYGRLAEGISRS